MYASTVTLTIMSYEPLDILTLDDLRDVAELCRDGAFPDYAIVCSIVGPVFVEEDEENE